ncbi:MAG: chromosomal replication initiator protein DnaA [Nitrospinae bacterium CG11_big_fil_rev_8_21_14_0_20_56_8]|nr:MAG: chromosomal replication initiator protein DnaA [Nitrospinae bacterium CG11_big_fil_rev_8_21_14_0_20_56_8]
MDAKEVLWNKCLETIEIQILPENFATWFSPTYLKSMNETSATLAVPNHFYRRCLSENYRDLIASALEKVSGKKLGIKFFIESEFIEENKTPAEAIADNLVPNRKAGSTEEHPHAVNPRYTFSNFVVGTSNQFAHAAAQVVANHPAQKYNPLFIYGGVGLGKTHLLHAIGNTILQEKQDTRVHYLTAERFTVDLIESLRKDRMPAFRSRYRPLDVLLVDDIQFIAGKERTQEEFFYTFNSLYDSHKQVVLSSDKYPKDIHDFEERLRSRLESGLIADIKLPDLETKVAILYKKAEFHQKPIPRDVALFIADNIKTNIRELEGLLLRIIAYASFTHCQITLELARDVLKDFTYDKNKNFNIPKILKTVASHFNIKVADLKSKKRSRDISIPRQVAMYLSREYTKASLPDIGRQFGGKDHTTVIFSYKKISGLVSKDNELARSIEQIVKKIERG